MKRKPGRPKKVWTKEIGDTVLSKDTDKAYVIAGLPDVGSWYLINFKTGYPHTKLIALAYLQTWFGWNSYIPVEAPTEEDLLPVEDL